MAGIGDAHLRDPGSSLLRVENLVVEFKSGRGQTVHAVTDVSIDVLEGETLGLVGESGCGKSTTGKAIMQLPSPTGGRVVFEGRELTDLEGKELRSLRTRLQMIFQDPISSLNPRRRVEDIIAEGLDIWKVGTKDERAAKVDELLLTVCDDGVGLSTARDDGLGLHSMRARAEELGGRLTIRPNNPAGCCIHAQLPLETGDPHGADSHSDL